MSFRARFIEPMPTQQTAKLPECAQWLYEIKLYSYRAIAFKAGGRVRLRSRNDKDFSARCPAIGSALSALPDETIVDGEVVALEEIGKSCFNLLQKLRIIRSFPRLLRLRPADAGRKRRHERAALHQARASRGRNYAATLEPIRESPLREASLSDFIEAVKAQGLEGPVAKRRDSPYEPGQRSGAWAKMRVNQIQDFVIGGYRRSLHTRSLPAKELSKCSRSEGEKMIDHIILTVSDVERSLAFYEASLAPLNIKFFLPYKGENGHPDLWGFGDGKRAFFWLKHGKPDPQAIHWGFMAEANAKVDEFYKAAMAAGAKDNISPRSRVEYYPGYYAADVFDPDGYSFEVVHKS